MTKDEISQAFNEGYMKGHITAINEQKSDKKELLDMAIRIGELEAECALYVADDIERESVVNKSLAVQKPLSDEELLRWQIFGVMVISL